MKKSKISKLLGIVLVLALCISTFAACSKTDEPETTTAAKTTTAAVETPTPVESQKTTPLVVGYLAFSEKFSPFFGETGYDMDVSGQTQVGLLTTDRTGGIVYNAIEGETIPYNGTDYTYTGMANVDVNYDEATDLSVYKWTIRDDIKFSDGTALTADDIIFSYYVLSDPTYAGSSTIYSVPILGMQNYRTQTSDEVYARFDTMFDDIYAAGEDHVWTSADSWTEEQQDALWAMVKDAWIDDVGAIVAYVNANYPSYFLDYTTYTPEEVAAEEGMQIMAGMVMWGFGSVNDDGSLTSAVLGKTWTLKDGDYPTLEDYYNETYAAYDSADSYWETEAADETTVVEIAKSDFISIEGPKDPSLAGKGVPNISGIKKLSQTEVEITVKGFDATAIYKLGISVAPLHYYGDASLYNYDNNSFGFAFGDLSSVQAKTTMPMGAGAYRFIKYENKVVYFEANTNYYKGEPITYYMQFKEGSDADKISGVATGTIDITDPSFGNAAVDEIKSYNSNGETSGDVVNTNTVNNLGYGYIGINADTVNVAGDPDSEESMNLRAGFATLLAAYRGLSIDSYYGERASVINYPISNTSWAAPQKSDEGYEIAFSNDVEGNSIYTSSMNAEDQYVAALDAAIGFFKAAGYTYNEGTGMFTAAPAGAKMEYEIIVPGDGAGDHPSFMLATKFKEVLESIGISIILNDPSDSNVLWDKLDAATQEMWAAAWGATIDPDMYQVYHSDNSTGSNHYHIADANLDQLIIDARKSDDQSYRKATYKACLDVIIDWAVEVPIYQRQNCIIFSSERVQLDTVTPDITTFWGWASEIETLEMIVD